MVAPPAPGARTDLLAWLALASGIGGLLGSIAGMLSMSMVCCCGWFGSATMLVLGSGSAVTSAAGMWLSLHSRKRQTQDPTLGGQGLATSALVLGLVSLLLSVVVIVLGAMALFTAAATAAGG
jgi:hypothetical protein